MNAEKLRSLTPVRKKVKGATSGLVAKKSILMDEGGTAIMLVGVFSDGFGTKGAANRCSIPKSFLATVLGGWCESYPSPYVLRTALIRYR